MIDALRPLPLMLPTRLFFTSLFVLVSQFQPATGFAVDAVAESAASADAADGASPSQSVLVRVRMIRAIGALASGNSQAAAGQSGSLQPSSLKRAVSTSELPTGDGFESGLKDVRSKLNKLGYRSFRLVSDQEEAIPLMKKQQIFLNEGNVLSVRPLYLDPKAEGGNKIGLWLRWLDGSGVKILDTRLHLHCGETMLTGTEGSNDTGTVLAIAVKPVE